MARRTLAAVVGIALALPLLVLATAPASAQVVVKPLKVVLLGDSYAAGNGARDAAGVARPRPDGDDAVGDDGRDGRRLVRLTG